MSPAPFREMMIYAASEKPKDDLPYEEMSEVPAQTTHKPFSLMPLCCCHYICCMSVCHLGWKDHLWIFLGPGVYWPADRVPLSGGSERERQFQPTSLLPLQGAIWILSLNRSDKPLAKKWHSIPPLPKAELNLAELEFVSSTAVIHCLPSVCWQFTCVKQMTVICLSVAGGKKYLCFSDIHAHVWLTGVVS